MVFTLGFWVLARTEAWFTSKGRRGKVIARVLMLFLGLVLLYAFLGILSEHVPLVLTTPGIRLIRAVRPAWGFLVSTPFEVTWTSKMDFIVGVPLSTVIALFVLTLLFLWMAQRAWKRIDR